MKKKEPNWQDFDVFFNGEKIDGITSIDYIPKNIIYEVQKSKLAEVHHFLRESIYELRVNQALIDSDIRVSMPKRLIEAIQIYNRELYGAYRTSNFPTQYENITVLENYKNEVAVFCIYYEKHEQEFIKILNLE